MDPRRDSPLHPSVMVVEDVMLIAYDLAEHLEEWGYEVVGPFSSVTKALPSAQDAAIDCALLDVNLGGQTCFPLAAVLRARGVPFVFLTGHDASFIPEQFRDAPRLGKPVGYSDLRRVVTELGGAAAEMTGTDGPR